MGDVAVIVLSGQILDAGNSQEFKDRIVPLLEENQRVVFDMGALQFVDSSGCGALLSCLRRLKAEGGNLKLCCVSMQVKSLFKLIRMDKILDIFSTRDEAVKAFQE